MKFIHLIKFSEGQKDCEKLHSIKQSEEIDTLHMERLLNVFSHHLFCTHGCFCGTFIAAYKYLANMN